MIVPYGCFNLMINGRKYFLYRQDPKTEKVAVIAAPLNTVKQISEMVISNQRALVAGANYYQMRQDVPGQPYGTTYGDLSAPLCGVFQSLPNQRSTLYYNLRNGAFGDCTGYNVPASDNVFSPALVYPNRNNHVEYATMVGLELLNVRSRYAFVIKFDDGYGLGIAAQDSTPLNIFDDFRQINMVNVAILDGGGSAQFGRYEDGELSFIRDTKRPIPSVVTIYRDAAVLPEITTPATADTSIFGFCDELIGELSQYRNVDQYKERLDQFRKGGSA